MSKSEMIREMLREMGMDASPTEISQKLTSQGHKVTPNLVSGIKIAMKKHRGRGRRGRGMPAHGMRGHAMQMTDARPSIEEVYKVWALAHQIGNDKLKQIVRHMP
jgi:hypothetical protein